MSDRKSLRLRVLEDGGLEILDPGFESYELIQALDPTFSIRQEPLPGFTGPRLLQTRETGTGVAMGELPTLPDDRLWQLHQAAAQSESPVQAGEASRLHVARELGWRMLRRCELCSHQCQVDRTRGERGRCGLGTQAFVYESYVHIAEEPPINPALNISLRGCGMRCRYCQQFPALSPRGAPGEALTPAFWTRLDFTGARSLTFIGGNPTESLPSVLDFLLAAPSDISLPIGWNCNGFDAVKAIRLLEGVCDFYIPDFKYGSEACATRLSGAPGYVENAQAVITEICRQKIPVFVRILVLPGHVKCCHLPSLELLRPLRSQIRVNIMGQYAPDFLIRETDGPLARRPDPCEVAQVRQVAEAMGFEIIDGQNRA